LGFFVYLVTHFLKLTSPGFYVGRLWQFCLQLLLTFANVAFEDYEPQHAFVEYRRLIELTKTYCKVPWNFEMAESYIGCTLWPSSKAKKHRETSLGCFLSNSKQRRKKTGRLPPRLYNMSTYLSL